MSTQPARRPIVARSVAALVLATLLAPVAPLVRDGINASADTRSGEVGTAVDASARLVRLPFAASHVFGMPSPSQSDGAAWKPSEKLNEPVP